MAFGARIISDSCVYRLPGNRPRLHAMDTNPTARPPPPALPVFAALACLGLATLLASLGTSIANVALPTFVRSFGAPFQSVQWVVLAYLLAVTTLVVSAGRLGDLFGRRRMMLAGIATFTAASLACAAAPSLGLLIAARVGQGAGAALMMALTLALVGEAVPKERAGRAMGLLGTTSAIGTALGPSLGGVLLGAFGWRAMFLVNLPLGALALVLAWRFLPRDRAASRDATAGFDLPGAVLLAGALAAYSLAMTLGRGHFGATNLSLAGIAAVLAVGFVAVEANARSPLVRPALFRDPVIAAGVLASALAATVAMTTLVVGPFHLSGALHLGATGVGLAMSIGPAVAALAGVPAGKAVDRFGAMRMTRVGLVMMTVGALLLARIPVASGVAGYVAALAMLTAGFATFQAANNTAIVTGVAAERRGVVSGLLNLSRNLGLVTGASLMGAVFMAGAGTSEIGTATAAAIASGTHRAFLVAAILVGLAFVATSMAQPRASRSLAAARP
jgi:EmrB/QacA subfamily drug resistance transporter